MGIAVVLVVVQLIALPFLINVNSFRPKIESEASSALGGQLQVGNLSLSILSGSVDAENLSISDDPAFSKSAFVTALEGLSAFAGKAVSTPDTSIQNASLNARASPEGTNADNINLNVPAIGVITAAGTVSPASELAFKMLANLHGGVVGGLSKVAGTSSGQGGIPFAIEGTTSNPRVVPEMGGAAASLANGQLTNIAKTQVPETKNLTKVSAGS